MTFSPKDHITKIQGKEYLEVKWRGVWFREENPHGSIITEVIVVADFAYVRAVVSADGVTLATGMATIRSGERQVWSGRDLEKAETAAIGRALAHAGFGTQFTDEDEGDNLADSPVDRGNRSPTTKQVRDTMGAGSHRAVTSEPANGASEKPVTPKNAPKNGLPTWRNAVLPAIKDMPHFGNSTHAANALNKMLADGQLTADMTAELVIQAVKDKYAAQPAGDVDLSTVFKADPFAADADLSKDPLAFE